MRSASHKPNYGDALVSFSIVKQLKYDNIQYVMFGQEVSNKKERNALIRGSTYLHNDFDFEKANKTIDSIDGQIAILGLGAQNPIQDIKFLDNNDGAKGFISRLNEKSRSISVRGDFTASVAQRLGGKNIRVTGCPSLFYDLKCPCISIPEMLKYPQRNIGISLLTQMCSNIFCNSPVLGRALHGKVIEYVLNNAANVFLFEQGVTIEYNICDQTRKFEDRLADAEKIVKTISAGFSAYDLLSRMVSVNSIEDWLDTTSKLDAMVGFRFHGNMIALLQGKPCYFFVYDSRIQEFCHLYSLPYQNVESKWKDPISSMLEHDWNETNLNINKCYNETIKFYDENGFKINLT